MGSAAIERAPARETRWWRPEPAAAEPLALRQAGGDRGGRLSFWCLMAFTFVMLLSPQSFVPGLAAVRPALLTAGVAIAAHLGERMLRGGSGIPTSREVWVAGALFAWAVVTLPFSFWPGGSLATLTELYLKSLLIFWLLGVVVDSLPRLRMLCLGLCACAVFLGVTAVRHYRAGDFMVGVTTSRIAGYDAALTENPNDLALMLNLLLPVAIALLLTRPRPGVRIGLAVTVAAIAVGVIVTFSRAGFLTLAAVALCWVWKLRRRPERGWAYLVIALAVAGLPFLPSSYLTRLGTMANADSDPTGSSQARREDLGAALRFVAEHPIVGAGIGQDVLALNAVRGPSWTAVHNVYLEHAVDLGLPGLVLFILLLGGTIRSAGRVARQAAREPRLADLSWLASGIQISLVAFAVGAFFHPVSYQFYFYYVAGLAVALHTVWARTAAGPALGRPIRG